MAILPDRVDERSEAYLANRASMLAHLAEHDAELATANAGGGPKYVERHRTRGKLMVRERVELLLDADSPFLELSPLAAWPWWLAAAALSPVLWRLAACPPLLASPLRLPGEAPVEILPLSV